MARCCPMGSTEVVEDADNLHALRTHPLPDGGKEILHHELLLPLLRGGDGLLGGAFGRECPCGRHTSASQAACVLTTAERGVDLVAAVAVAEVALLVVKPLVEFFDLLTCQLELELRQRSFHLADASDALSEGISVLEARAEAQPAFTYFLQHLVQDIHGWAPHLGGEWAESRGCCTRRPRRYFCPQILFRDVVLSGPGGLGPARILLLQRETFGLPVVDLGS
mmetsp:Transcript_21988/g.46769  ORF Transcript_21988/g.46769 Transcript_21988/m.46769 type:complete len:223 (+) Transcript_21988:393-1061(+)